MEVVAQRSTCEEEFELGFIIPSINCENAILIFDLMGLVDDEGLEFDSSEDIVGRNKALVGCYDDIKLFRFDKFV